MSFAQWVENAWPDATQEEVRKMSSAYTAAKIEQASSISDLEDRIERYRDEIRDTTTALNEIRDLMRNK